MAHRNVTVTLEEEVARWARVYAARHDTSVSGLLAQMLKQRMSQEDAYDSAMRRALSRKAFLRTDGRYPTREDLHGRRARIR